MPNRRRFPSTLHLADYSADELASIVEARATSQYELTLENDVRPKLVEALKTDAATLADLFRRWYELIGHHNVLIPQVERWSSHAMAQHRMGMPVM